MKIYIKDILAILVIIAGFAFVWFGRADAWMQGILAMIIAYYFARREDINGNKKAK